MLCKEESSQDAKRGDLRLWSTKDVDRYQGEKRTRILGKASVKQRGVHDLKNHLKM
jgi:hypothetical protein